MTVRVGALIRGLRAGDTRLAVNRIALAPTLSLRSVFADGAPIPVRCTEDGEGVAPGLAWDGLPAGTAELALVVQDPDAPLPRPIVHAVLVGIAPEARGLEEGAWKRTGTFGTNTFRKRSFLPPAPIPAHGPHRYVFQLVALDRRIGLAAPSLSALMRAIDGHVLACGTLTGTYERP